MENLPIEVIVLIIQNCLDSQTDINQLVKLSHVNSVFRRIVLSSCSWWKDLKVHTFGLEWILQNCQNKSRIELLQAQAQAVMYALYFNLRSATSLKSLVRKSINLRVLDVSNCSSLTVKQILEIFTENNSVNLQYLDITGIGKDAFQTLDEFHDYWFQGVELINDLGKLSQLLPNTCINPSVCSNCQRNTCYPPDVGLYCVFCKEAVVWVCDDCELECYRICYQCVQEDQDHGFDVVCCGKCIQNTRQNVCHKCEDWKCPNHVDVKCGC